MASLGIAASENRSRPANCAHYPAPPLAEKAPRGLMLGIPGKGENMSEWGRFHAFLPILAHFSVFFGVFARFLAISAALDHRTRFFWHFSSPGKKKCAFSELAYGST